MAGVDELNKMQSGGRRPPASCRNKSCIGVIRITKDMRSGLVYRSKIFGILTWTQAALGLASIGIYVFLYAESQLGSNSFQRGESTIKPNFGAGIIASGIQIFGVMVTLLAIHEVNYCWLHLAMSMHIMTVLAQSLLSIHTIFIILPGGTSTNSTTINKEGFDNQHEVTRGPTIMNGSYWEERLTILVSACAMASMCFGSFLASATGYAVCCGWDTREKRKSSLDGIKDPKDRSIRRERKLVKFGFEPSNVAANLGVGIHEADPYPSFERSLGTPQDSVIYINRHAQMHKNETLA